MSHPVNGQTVGSIPIPRRTAAFPADSLVPVDRKAVLTVVAVAVAALIAAGVVVGLLLA